MGQENGRAQEGSEVNSAGSGSARHKGQCRERMVEGKSVRGQAGTQNGWSLVTMSKKVWKLLGSLIIEYIACNIPSTFWNSNSEMKAFSGGLF